MAIRHLNGNADLWEWRIGKSVANAGQSIMSNNTWQDISTAPRDGTPVILGEAGAQPQLARWLSLPEGEGWFSFESDISGFNPWRAFPPSHWMPLPDPPTV